VCQPARSSTRIICLLGPAPTWMPFPTATPTVVPPLARVPTNCPVIDAHPQAEFSQPHAVIGVSPLWATWEAGPCIFHGAPEEYLSSYSWAMTKTIWEVGPNYSDMVSVLGEDNFDHTPLLFQFGGDTATAIAVLDSPTSRSS
jgi:hypothetical protein